MYRLFIFYKKALLVFVGEKIKVDKFKPEMAKGQIPFDEAFKAKYRVIQQVYGNYKTDTIDFEAYDHMGVPPFSKIGWWPNCVEIDTFVHGFRSSHL